jgi:hypothetical protein
MQKYDLEIEINCPGIGDLLTYTPIFKYYKNCLVKMIDNEKGHIGAPLFNDLCSVVFEKNVGDNINGNVPYQTHTAAKRLIQLGLTHVSPIPEIIIKDKEILKGVEILNKYNIDISKPILAIVADANGSHNIENTFGKTRMMSLDRWESLLSHLSKYYQLIQFGLSNKITDLPYTTKILDLNIRDLASCYKVIRKYLGIDTGDYHLMIAIGGKSIVFCPKNGEGNEHPYWTWQWHYQDNWFQNGARSKYIYKNFELLRVNDIINESHIFLNDY